MSAANKTQQSCVLLIILIGKPATMHQTNSQALVSRLREYNIQSLPPAWLTIYNIILFCSLSKSCSYSYRNDEQSHRTEVRLNRIRESKCPVSFLQWALEYFAERNCIEIRWHNTICNVDRDISINNPLFWKNKEN